MKNLNLPPPSNKSSSPLSASPSSLAVPPSGLLPKTTYLPNKIASFETCNTTWNMGYWCHLRTTRQQGN
jgi:hypothetical protein